MGFDNTHAIGVVIVEFSGSERTGCPSVYNTVEDYIHCIAIKEAYIVVLNGEC